MRLELELPDDANKMLIKKSAEARKALSISASAVDRELRDHLLQNNTETAGVIMWLKRGMSTDVCSQTYQFQGSDEVHYGP